MQILLEIFIDSLRANFILTFGKEIALPLLFYFENSEDKNLAIITAFFGSTIGLFSSYAICYLLAKILAKFFDNYNYRNLQHYCNKFLYLFGVILPFPEINIIFPFFCGFLKTKWLKTLIIMCIYRIAYYVYFLYNFENVIENI
ncbi:MAG: hypothetical protein SFT90_02760 [Rickettsiales bacterium]|nr:hypothetical protein [Rickettsiales bacterium]